MELQEFSKKKEGNDWLKLDWVGKLSNKVYSKTNIPSALKNLEYSPTNIPFGRVSGQFVGNDDLRPIMTYVNWDKENKNDEMEEKEDKEIPECVIVPADSDDEPQPLPF